MNRNINKNTKTMVSASVFTALIMVLTAYIKLNIGANGGYIHFGDSMIYLAACVLPLPFAAGAAALGGALADIFAGAAVWCPFTAVIKALNVLPFAMIYLARAGKSRHKIISVPSSAASVMSGLVTVIGYFFAEYILYGAPAATASVPFSLVQAAGSCIVFVCAGAALDGAGFTTRAIVS